MLVLRRNEPDLNAPCIAFNSTQWVHYVIVQTNAINAAFGDLNADYAAGLETLTQTFLRPPIQPIIAGSAFASVRPPPRVHGPPDH